jgi:hypothetical protein
MGERDRRIGMLLGAKNTVIYGTGDRGAGTVGGFGGVAEQLDAAFGPGSRRLEMLAALWARQTGRPIVVAPGGRG